MDLQKQVILQLAGLGENLMKKLMFLFCGVIVIGLTPGQEPNVQDAQRAVEHMLGAMTQYIVIEQGDVVRQLRQANFIENLASTAPRQNFHVHGDPSDTLLSVYSELNLLASIDDQQTWYTGDCSLMVSSGYLNSFDCDVDLPESEQVTWYLRATLSNINGSTYATQTPLNTTGVFPPPSSILAPLAIEAVGDVELGTASQDIVELQGTYDTEKIHIKIVNELNDFPTGEFFGPWFLYGAGISNPEQDITTTPVVVYALGYANGAFGELHPGLLKLVAHPNGNIISFEYITDDIQYEITDEGLYLSIDLNYITSDPDFGDWPNSFGGFLITGMTASADINQNFSYHDGTVPSIMVLETQFQAGNEAPVLEFPQYDPEILTASVFYHDPDGNLALLHRAIAENSNHVMIPETHDYLGGTWFDYQFSEPLAANTEIQFQYYDGDTWVNETITTEGCALAGDANLDGMLNVLDIVVTVEIILGTSSEITPCMDMNGDESIDVLDIVVMVEAILQGI